MKIVALAGGVGGAKMVDGFAQILNHKDLSVIVNTADDFIHFGLYISPDLDTVCYTLSKLANSITGWGRENESWSVLEQLKQLGAPTWFNLGDKDLATHIERTRRILLGEKLSTITKDFLTRWGCDISVFPMSDEKISTMIRTIEGKTIPFQEYFVKYQFQPVIKNIYFEGINSAMAASGVIKSIDESDVIVICPSNPFVSIDPILRTPGIIKSIKEKKVVAISPIIEGRAVKGPAAKMSIEMGIKPCATSIALHYQNLLAGFILDNRDKNEMNDIFRCGIITKAFDIVMSNRVDRKKLAQNVLNFIEKEL